MSIIRNDLCLIKVVFLYALKIFVNFSEITLHEKQNKIHILHKWNVSKGKVVGSEEWSVDVWGH